MFFKEISNIKDFASILQIPKFKIFVAYLGALQIYYNHSQEINMKRSLAGRRDKSGLVNYQQPKILQKKNSTLQIYKQEANIHLNHRLPNKDSRKDFVLASHYEDKYRNKNLSALNASMLVALSSLTTLDISYNKLTDVQIELIMKTCNRLVTFYVQGNHCKLIPASIVKLKSLLFFRHDWVNIQGHQLYCQPAKTLDRMKQAATKPNFLEKINNTAGLSFVGYCIFVLKIPIDRQIEKKIKRYQFTAFGRQNMLSSIHAHLQTERNQKPIKIQESGNSKSFLGCFKAMMDSGKQILKINLQENEEQKIGNGLKKSSFLLKQQDDGQKRIIISDIRDISKNQVESTIDISLNNQQLSSLHTLFSTFDTNPMAPHIINNMLMRGFNPNSYNEFGFTVFHLCIIYDQIMGLQFILQTNQRNPGFYDLLLGTLKQNRNILHLCAFLKNITLANILIESGFPLNIHDKSQNRPVHLIDQNYQFLFRYRKKIKRTFQQYKPGRHLKMPKQFEKKIFCQRRPVSFQFGNHKKLCFQTNMFKDFRLIDQYERAIGYMLKRQI